MTTEFSNLEAFRFSGPSFPIRRAEDGTPLHPITGSKMEEVEPGVWQDPMNRWMQEAMMRASDNMMKAIQRDFAYPALRKFKDPWPKAGHDFRLNHEANKVPEPTHCDCCGHSLDDWDDW